MTNVVKFPESTKREFGLLSDGQALIYKGKLYLVTEDTSGTNCIDVVTGETDWFGRDTMVQPVDLEIIVK